MTVDDERRARELLARFFAGLGLAPGARRDELIEVLVARAAAAPEGDGPVDLAQLALEAVEAELRAWFALVLRDEASGDGDALLVGRAAWCACGAAGRWPDALLAREPPADLVEAIRAAAPVPLPPEQPGAMLEQPFASWSMRDFLLRPRATRLLPRRSAPA